MITWTGSSIDPPGFHPPSVAAAPPQLPQPSAPAGVWTSVSEQNPLQNPDRSFRSSFVPVPQYPYDSRLFRIDPASTSPSRYFVQVSTTQGRTWDQVGAYPQYPYPCQPNVSVTLTLSPTFGQDSTMLLSGSTPCSASRDGGRTWNRFPARITSGYSSGTITFSPTFAADQRLWLRGLVNGHPNLETTTHGGGIC